MIDPPQSRRRARRPLITQTPAFRIIVPVLLSLLALAAVVVAALAAAVLMGFLPYPGK